MVGLKESMAPGGGYANHSFLELRVNSNPCVMTDNSTAAELWVINKKHNSVDQAKAKTLAFY